MIGVILLPGLVTKTRSSWSTTPTSGAGPRKDRWTALVEAGQVRLRPIAMTTLAMIFGMLPIASGRGGWHPCPMARRHRRASTSTMLTLIVVDRLPTSTTWAAPSVQAGSPAEADAEVEEAELAQAVA